MSLFVLPFPAFDPVLIQIGPFAIRWYALAYIAGIFGGWFYAKKLAGTPPLWCGGVSPIPPHVFDDVILWVTLGIVLGGRLGFVLFYEPAYFLNHPLDALAIWRGGMAFHGGVLGAALALILFSRRRALPLLSMLDIIAAVAPIGLFLGRIANFINGELWGKPTDVLWAMVFPWAGPEPRHPSQLYEAGLEGLLLFVVLNWMVWQGGFKRSGFVSGCFGIGYFVTRSLGEIFRAQDGEFMLLGGWLTMGILLSLPMLLIGAVLVWRSRV